MYDWINIWSRELIESPPVEVFAAAYFRYEAPGDGSDDADDGPVDFGLPEFEE